MYIWLLTVIYVACYFHLSQFLDETMWVKFRIILFLELEKACSQEELNPEITCLFLELEQIFLNIK